VEANDGYEENSRIVGFESGQQSGELGQRLTLDDANMIGVEKKHVQLPLLLSSSAPLLRASRPYRNTSSNSGYSFIDPETRAIQLVPRLSCSRITATSDSRAFRRSSTDDIVSLVWQLPWILYHTKSLRHPTEGMSVTDVRTSYHALKEDSSYQIRTAGNAIGDLPCRHAVLALDLLHT
jgi:hypothetical protein